MWFLHVGRIEHTVVMRQHGGRLAIGFGVAPGEGQLQDSQRAKVGAVCLARQVERVVEHVFEMRCGLFRQRQLARVGATGVLDRRRLVP